MFTAAFAVLVVAGMVYGGYRMYKSRIVDAPAAPNAPGTTVPTKPVTTGQKPPQP